METISYGHGVYKRSPQVDEAGSPLKKEKENNFKNRMERVKFFINGKDFQNFCNYPENQVEPGTLMQVVIGFESKIYALGEDKYLEGFYINVMPHEGYRFVKTKGLFKPESMLEKKVYYAESFYVIRIGQNFWKAIPLLKDEEYLCKQKVEKAFDKISDKRRYDLGEVFVAEVFYPGQSKLMAWATEVFDKTCGQKRYLICMLDNGRIIDESASDVEIIPYNGKNIKTKFCSFLFETKNNLRRLR